VELVEKILNGDVRAAARLMRDIDSDSNTSRDALKALYAHTGHARIIGLTGSPGVGKSTLIGSLIHEFRRRGQSVGAVVVDPSSPFTAGALMGDRVRMQQHADDKHVFIHSTTTSGSTGGISLSVPGIVTIMDAMGKDVVLVETVGSGQVGIDIRHLVHTNVVVVAPTMGDQIQALKAGILESAHIFALNKSDQPTAAATLQSLKMIIQLGKGSDKSWLPAVVQTVATDNQGIRALADHINRHHEHVSTFGPHNRPRQRMRGLLALILRERIVQSIRMREGNDAGWEPLIEQLIQKSTDPYSAADVILDKIVTRFYETRRCRSGAND